MLKYKIAIMASAAAATMSLATPAFAQSEPDAEEANEDIVVTGTAGGASLRRQDASFAITTVSAEDLAIAAPKSTAEIFTLVPGVWAESSGGVAGANIDVRGLPGGGDAPFVTISLNGAPIYGTPSLSFFEQSSIFRADETIQAVEALRGGPNAVFGRGEPGVTLNFRLMEGGEETEGLLKLSTSDYGLQRVDARLSGKLAENLYFLVGGYASVSPGIRDAQFNSERGYQFTAHLTYEHDRGSIGVFTRLTDDHGQWYLPMSLVSGNDLGTFSQLGTATRFRTLRVNAAGDTERFDFAGGRGWKGSVSGLNAEFDVSDAITLRDNLAYTRGAADTLGFVPDGAPVRVSALAGGTARTLGGTVLAGTEFVQNYGHWVVEKDLESLANDLSLSIELGNNDLTIGYYRSSYSSDDFWTLGNFTPVHNVQNGDFLSTATTCADLQAAGSGSGCWAFGIDSAGDARNHALYLADTFQVTDKLRFDVGVRRESIDLSYVLDTGPGYPDGVRDLAVNLHDSQWAYTGAVNYAFSDAFGVFLRYSDGFVLPNFDDIRENNLNVNGIQQAEVGIKYTSDHLNLYATGFRTKNDSFDSVVGGTIPATAFRTRSTGVEIDGRLRFGAFNLGFLGTIQDATVTASSTPAFVGNDVHRQPNWQARLTPSYELELGDWSATLYGAMSSVGKRWSELGNIVRLPGYTKVDLGLSIESPWGLFGQVHADNLFDSHGITEGDPRSATTANGRPILGRSVRFSIGYRF
ncbi:MAG: TonB-dependent receptor [Pseudomonadota bacterium]